MSNISIEHLVHEHRQIEAVSAQLESLLASEKVEPVRSAERALALAWILRSFIHSLIPHMRKEEDLLFPMLEGFLPRDSGPLAVLRGELRELHAQLDRLRGAGAALCRGDTQPQTHEDFQHFGRIAIRSLADHIYNEERILFPMIGRLLPSDWDAHLLRQMETMNTSVASLPPSGQKD